MKSAEFRLALRACSTAFGGEPAGADGGVIDWPRFVAICRRHRIQGLAHAGLPHLGMPVPTAEAEALAADAQAIAARNLTDLAASARILSAMDQADIPVLFIKGMSLATLAYPQPMLKMSWDVDILIAPEQLEAAGRTLEMLDYRHVVPRTGLRQWHDRRKESVWTNGVTQVELHTRLADNESLIPAMTVRSPRQVVTLPGGVSLPTLAGDELFAYLCVHGASSAWFRLKWITDLAALLHGLPGEEVDRLFERSQGLVAGRSAGQALLLASQLFDTALSPKLRGGLQNDRAVQRMLTFARRQMSGALELGEPTRVRFGTVGIHVSQLFLLPGLRFKAAEALRQVGVLFSDGARARMPATAGTPLAARSEGTSSAAGP